MTTAELSDMAVNRAAKFHPVTDADSLPAIEVAGVLVFAYVDDGTLRVSVDLDDSELGQGPDQLTPMRITVQGDTVFQA